MSKPNKRIFISDIHLGPKGNEANWFKKDKHTENLVAALEWAVEHSNEVKDLVFLGDLFDTWVMPVDQSPPTVADIIDYHSEVKEAIKACTEELNVFYLNGNHDMHVTQEDLEPLASGANRVQHIGRYRSGLLYAEHGHRFAMFNAPDKLHDPIDGLPIGYFISRVLASGDKPYDAPSALVQYVDDILEAAFTSQKLVESVIEAVVEHVDKVSLEDEVTMPNGRRPVTLEEVQEKYAPLYDRWVAKFGQWYTLHSTRAELGSLGWFADRLASNDDYNVVVLGHTHNPQSDHDFQLFDTGRIYANSGYWCTKTPTMVEVEKTDTGYDVGLFRFQDGQRNEDPIEQHAV